MNLRSCTKLGNLDLVAKFPLLSDLDLSYQEQLIDVDPLHSIKHLQKLNLGYCRNLDHIDGISASADLRSINLEYCESLKNLDGLISSTELEEISLTSCTELNSLEGLRNAGQVKQIDLSECQSLKQLSGLEGMQALRVVDLNYCSSLRNIDEVTELPDLEEIHLLGCPYLSDLSILESVKTLQEIWSDTPEQNISILSVAACLRKDPVYIKDHISEWLEVVENSPEREQVLNNLLSALVICPQDRWVLTALERVLRILREQGILECPLRECLTLLAEYDFTDEIKDLSECCLKPGTKEQSHAQEERIRAYLSALPDFPESARDWAIFTAKVLIEPAQQDGDLLEATGAEIVRFFARMNQNEMVDRWLTRITQYSDNPTASDTTYAALANYYLSENKTEQAIKIAARIQGSVVRDPLSRQLAEYFVTQNPDLSAGQFQLIADTALKSKTAKSLMQDIEFTSNPSRFCELLMAVQDDRETLLELIETVISQHPEAKIFSEIFSEMDVMTVSDPLEDVLDELVAAEVITSPKRERIVAKLGDAGRSTIQSEVRSSILNSMIKMNLIDAEDASILLERER